MFEPAHAALQDFLRVFFATANMLKNHLPLLAGATNCLCTKPTFKEGRLSPKALHEAGELQNVVSEPKAPTFGSLSS